MTSTGHACAERGAVFFQEDDFRRSTGSDAGCGTAERNINNKTARGKRREEEKSEKQSAMGRIFLDHIGGTRLFSCANCDTILTNRSELISTRFTGATGRAFLFNKVVNLQYSEVQDRVMLTGRHMVRDVSCKNCNSKLGWIYEFATEDSQRYKEGRVILERALVRESEGFEEHVPSDAS
ncbi:hypothetical protein MHYP_G00061180 [Metynnis hypsauchen]